MHTVTISLEPEVLCFYSRIARAMNLSVEQVLCDALFQLAGELSMDALNAASPSCEYFS